MTKEAVYKEYIKYKSLSVRSKKIEDIKFYIRKWLFFNKNRDIKDYDEHDLLAFFDEINKHYAIGTQNNIKTYVKNFVKWYYKDWSSRFRNLDNICRTQTPDPAYKPTDMLKEEDFQKLIKGEESLFWKAYFMTLFYGGCRPIEVCYLKWSQLEKDKDGGMFITIHSKKNKRNFTKYLPSDVAFYINKLQTNESEYVFFNKNTKQPLTTKGAYWKIRKLSKKVLGKQIDLYTLRHSIATILYNKDTIKDDDIAKQLGHSKSMKFRYVHNDRDKLKERAKNIYLNPEELPPEKKHALEIEVEKLRAELVSVLKHSNNLTKEIEDIRTTQEENLKPLRDMLKLLTSKKNA